MSIALAAIHSKFQFNFYLLERDIKMKKLLLSLTAVIGLMSSYTVAVPQETTVFAASSKAEKLNYYNKQIAKLKVQLNHLESQESLYAKSSEKYRAVLDKEIAILNELKYYYDLIIKL